jgi:hypothetical protein
MFILKSFVITSTLITTISLDIVNSMLNNLQLKTLFSWDTILLFLIYSSYIKIHSKL